MCGVLRQPVDKQTSTAWSGRHSNVLYYHVPLDTHECAHACSNGPTTLASVVDVVHLCCMCIHTALGFLLFAHGVKGKQLSHGSLRSHA
jgi:hypothetical protein